MKIQNIAGINRTSFKAKNKNFNHLYKTFMFIANNFNQLENKDIYVSNPLSGNKKEQQDEILAPADDNQNVQNPSLIEDETLPETEEQQEDIVTAEVEEPKAEEPIAEQTTEEEQPETIEEDEKEDVVTVEPEITEQEEDIVTTEPENVETEEEQLETTEQEQQENAEDVPQETDEVIVISDTDENDYMEGETEEASEVVTENQENTDDTKKTQEQPKVLSFIPLSPDNYQPRHMARDGAIPPEEAAKLDIAVISAPREKGSRQIITERLDWYKGRKETIPVSGRMFNAMCELKPQTLKAFKNDELLFLMTAKEEFLKRIFKNDTLGIEERIKMLHEMEDTFTPEEIQKISFDDEDNARTILCFARWLLAFQSVASKEHTVKYLKSVPPCNRTYVKCGIIERLTPPKPPTRFDRFLQGFKKNRHKLNVD